jgi:hypothetical protein
MLDTEEIEQERLVSERERLENEQEMLDTEKIEQERLVSERERLDNGQEMLDTEDIEQERLSLSGRGWPMDMEQERLDSEREMDNERLDNGHGEREAGQKARAAICSQLERLYTG